MQEWYDTISRCFKVQQNSKYLKKIFNSMIIDAMINFVLIGDQKLTSAISPAFTVLLNIIHVTRWKILQCLSLSIDCKNYEHGSPCVLSNCCLVPAVLQMSVKIIHTFHISSHWKLGSNRGLQYAHCVPLITLHHSQTGIMYIPKCCWNG